MPKPRGLEAKLAWLRDIRKATPESAHVGELRDAIKDSSNLVVGDAADIVCERTLTELFPDLVTAFDRFMIEPLKTDKLCRAKLAILETLNKFEYGDEAIFRKAIRHVQLEPRWGDPEDTAAPLRGVAAYALVRLGCRDILMVLMELLTDPETVTRISAAKALGACGRVGALPLLHLKIRLGDAEPEVIAECLSALMVADPAESLQFVSGYLEADNEVIQQGAAFALAESRRPEALEILKRQVDRVADSASDPLLLAISMMRIPEATDFLIGLVETGDRSTATSAITALAIHRHNTSLCERIAGLLQNRGDEQLLQAFAAAFHES